MKHVVFDTETDGLLPELTKIHCLVLRDVETNNVFSCTDDGDSATYHSIEWGLRCLEGAEVVYGHNSIGFDIPAIQKVYPTFRLNGQHRDTFIIAGMRFAHLKDSDYALAKAGKFPAQFAGRHSLEAWGHRLGKPKGDYTQWCKDNGIAEPWAQWRPEMQTYCEGDTDTTRELVLKIREAGVSPESVETELELRDYLVKQEQNGWPFDVAKATALQARLSARREELTTLLCAEFGSWEEKAGVLIPKRDNKSRGYVAGVPVQKWKTVVFNPGSRDHIANRLKARYGWEPTEFTDNGKPKVDESTLKGLDYSPVKMLSEYLLVGKRLGQLSEGKEAWLLKTKLNPITGLQHIHGRVMQNATITHRAAHANPNVAQVPKVGNPYGAECRELYYVPDGWVQIGADASSLEARCLGHYVARYDGGAYAKLLLEGDVHTSNRIAFGLPEGKQYRDRAKTGYYAWLFGAGPEKLGRTLYPDKPASRWRQIGIEATKKMLASAPGLKYLIDAIQPRAKSPGYITGLDGRLVYIRSEHAALNTLIQAAGAVVCKRWLVVANRELTRRFGPQGWNGQWAALGWIHDEVQIAVRPEIADEVCRILVDSIESLTDHFKFRCPLTGEAKVGGNWKETH